VVRGAHPAIGGGARGSDRGHRRRRAGGLGPTSSSRLEVGEESG
jgi:hypothetical protein